MLRSVGRLYLGPAGELHIPARFRRALSNPVSTLHTRIDLILSRAAARSDGDEAVLIGATPFAAEPPFWISDHAGVVAEVRLGR